MIRLQHDPRPELEAIRALYAAAPLRRPVADLERMHRMFEHANVVISAWDGPRLVGLLRGWTDYAFDGYVCDLAVHPDLQKSGVGRRLLDAAAALGPHIHWILLASPLAKDYYRHLGWKALEGGWELPRPSGPMPDYDTFRSETAELARRA